MAKSRAFDNAKRFRSLFKQHSNITDPVTESTNVSTTGVFLEGGNRVATNTYVQRFAEVANTVPKAGGLFTGDVVFANTARTHSLTVNTTILFSNTNMGSGASHPPHQEGLLFYDNKHKTLNYYSDDSGVIHELGLEEHQRVYNNTGSTIGKGKPLYFSGNYTAGDVDVPTVGLADATDVNAYNAQGLAASDIPNNSYGYCIIAGQLHDVDTSALSAGQNFFVGLTPGAVQNQSPTYPNFPMCLGWVVSSDASEGVLLVNQQNHSVNSFRVRTSAHIGTDLRIDGNLTVVGTTTTTSTAEQTTGTTMFRLNEGSAIGEAGTTFTGTGLDDAFFSGHFTGTTATTYYVRICTAGAGLGTGGVDTFDVALNSGFNPMLSTNNDITGSAQLIHSADNISVEFGATTGHTANDQWSGTASPVNVDTGFWTNRNTGTSGVGYTHMGLYFDVTDDKWKLVQGYRPTPAGTIDQSNNSHSFATLVANTFQGKLIGNVTGTVTGTATSADSLSSSRNIQLTGDVTGVSPFNGTNNAVITTVVASSVTAPYLEKANASIYLEAANAVPITGGTFTGSVTFNDTAIFGGSVTQLGNQGSDSIQVTGRISTDFIPNANNARDLGKPSNQWAVVYANTFLQNGQFLASNNYVQRYLEAANASALYTTKAYAASNTYVNTQDNAILANTNPRFDLYLEVANATPSVDTTFTGNTSIQRLDIEDNDGTSVFSTNLNNGLFFGNNYFISSYDFEKNTTSTSKTTIAVSKGGEVAVEFLVLVTDTTTSPPERQFSKILAIHDGTDAFISEYGRMYTGSGPLASFSAYIVRTPDYLYLEANPTTSNRLKYKVTRMGMRD